MSNTQQLTEHWMFPDKDNVVFVKDGNLYEQIEAFEFVDEANKLFRWNVNAARRIIRESEPRQIYTIRWDNINETLQSGKYIPDISEEYAIEHSDLRKPVIIVPAPDRPDKQVMIDGNHRMIKAWRLQSDLLCVHLTMEESKRVMLPC